ncbi:MAG: signal peptidase I [Treponemataceae bacterium]|nr:signal peptidase I [Treponemataceae bacterium]
MKKKDSEQKNHYFLFVLIGVVTAVFLKFFVVDFLRVSGESMEPAVHDGSYVAIFKLAYGIVKPFSDSYFVRWGEPAAGDIVYFWHDGKPVLKRVVATEGETLEFSSESGYSLYVDGLRIPLTEQQFARIKYDSVVPEGTVLAIGDNYSVSVDSRNYGFVKTQHIIGKVLCLEK